MVQDSPVVAPAMSLPSRPMGRPSRGENMMRSCSFSANRSPTSGSRRITCAPLPLNMPCMAAVRQGHPFVQVRVGVEQVGLHI